MNAKKTIDIINGREVNLSAVYKILDQGKSINAIQFIKEQSGISLKEAKEYVDRLKAESGLQEVQHRKLPGNENTKDQPEDYNNLCLKKLFSEHKDISKFSWKTKILSLFWMWLFWGAIWGITHVPIIRDAIIHFVAENHTVDWLTFWADIILNKLPYTAIIFMIGSIGILLEKQKYAGLKIYNHGIGFLVLKTGEELYSTYEEINLDYGKWQSSVRIECKPLKIKEQFYFKDFSQPDVMENNLERFAVWGMHTEGEKPGRI